MSSLHLKLHDRVSWNTPRGMTQGKVVRVISTRTTVDGKSIDASESDPRYEVESDKSGKHAVHRSDALRHLKD
ncbi:hypothetical protein CIC12_00285 [Burkholderia sp. SG-MS1]|uniref:DUF2945 domain-containing protein n=1 Tax=Paraburkholderia sp. SG-MS1 TaxID=2023741 RepID=UPI001447CF4D|nr:DUF2945 domain-containing protein [Paraburkholderia sp. SG-MS1]NKJ45208.1 hypothetical protein [Paraburkholderia sp. SG-MS1]